MTSTSRRSPRFRRPRRRLPAVALLAITALGGGIAAAGPAAAATTSTLTSADVSGWGLYVFSPNAVDVTDNASQIQKWNVIDQGHGTWGNVTGESYEFQKQGTNQCLTWAHNILFAGDPTYLTTCLSTGTSWVLSDSDGLLYSRAEANVNVDAVLAMSSNPSVGSPATVVPVGEADNGTWSADWSF